MSVKETIKELAEVGIKPKHFPMVSLNLEEAYMLQTVYRDVIADRLQPSAAHSQLVNMFNWFGRSAYMPEYPKSRLFLTGNCNKLAEKLACKLACNVALQTEGCVKADALNNRLELEAGRDEDNTHVFDPNPVFTSPLYRSRHKLSRIAMVWIYLLMKHNQYW